MRRSDRVSLCFVAAALLASVLLIGGALRWTHALVATLVVGALVTKHFSRRIFVRASPLLTLIGVAIVLTAIQLIPLPTGIVESLSPIGAELRKDGAELVGATTWSSLSMDPAGTLRALALFVTLFGLAVASLRFSSTDSGRFRVLAMVALTCGAVALVTGIHALVNADAVYGLYEPTQAAPPILGPLLNSNHLGCLMAFGAVLSSGLAFHAQQASQLRVLWVVIAFGCTLLVAGSTSRGALIGLALGVLMMLGTLIAARLRVTDAYGRNQRAPFTRDLPIALTIIVGLALAIFANGSQVVDQIDQTSVTEVDQPLSKYAAWRSSGQLIAESPWVGIGRGAFEPAFTRVHEPSAYFTFSHVESEYVQAVVEWGVPGAVAIALAFGWCVLMALRGWRDGPLASAALGAITVVLFQSSVDFGVELLGIAVPATMVAATLLVVPLRETSSKRRLATRGALASAVLIAGLITLLPMTRTVQEDHDELVKRMIAPSELKDIVERHPLDYVAYAHAAVQAGRAKDPKQATLLNHALRLHPSHPGLHRLTARMLVASGKPGQAAIEYSLAVLGTLKPNLLLAEILEQLPNIEHAAAAIPTNYRNIEGVLRYLNEVKRNDVAEKWLARVVESKRDQTLIDKLYDLAMARNDLGTAKRAAELRLEISRTTTSRLMLARVRAKRKDWVELVSSLQDVASWHGRTDEQADAWLLLCDAHHELKRYDQAVNCLHRLDASGIVQPTKRGPITKRLQEIAARREFEAKTQAFQHLETLKKMPDVPMVPVVPSTDTSKPAPMHTPETRPPRIENPLRKKM